MVNGFCWRLFTFDFSNKFRENSEIFLKVKSHQNNVCGRLVFRQLDSWIEERNAIYC